MKEKILKILKKKQLRYVTKEYLGVELYKEIIKFTSFLEPKHKLSEHLYCIINDISQHPKCPYCKIEIHPTFKGINTKKDQYLNTYCCISHSRKRKFKTQSICQNPNCNKEVQTKNNLYCSKTCYYQCSNNTLQKRQTTTKKKYGVDNVSKSEFIIDKIKSTKLKRYGDINYNNPSVSSMSRHKTTYKSLERFKDKIIPLFTEEEFIGIGYHNIYKWQCVKCNNIFEWWYNMGLLPKCHKCHPNQIGHSQDEKEIFTYIKSIYNYNIITNSKQIIKPLELDIYIPEKKIAIEFNGLYWHSNLHKDKNYHLNKTKLCNEQDIQLIHIFEDEWQNKKQIVKNRLKHILGLTPYKIYGRKCIIKEIDVKNKNNFINKYHLQSNDKSQIKLGAYYKNRLVAVMTFGSLRPALGRYKQDGYYELIRFCTIGNFNIIGIASKLLKHFERQHKPLSIISYADRRWSNGNLYYNLNFKLNKTNPVSYWYFMNNSEPKRYHRYGFRKNILNKKLKIYDPKLSEWQNLQNNGYNKIYDCGTLCFIKDYKS